MSHQESDKRSPNGDGKYRLQVIYNADLPYPTEGHVPVIHGENEARGALCARLYIARVDDVPKATKYLRGSYVAAIGVSDAAPQSERVVALEQTMVRIPDGADLRAACCAGVASMFINACRVLKMQIGSLVTISGRYAAFASEVYKQMGFKVSSKNPDFAQFCLVGQDGRIPTQWATLTAPQTGILAISSHVAHHVATPGADWNAEPGVIYPTAYINNTVHSNLSAALQVLQGMSISEGILASLEVREITGPNRIHKITKGPAQYAWVNPNHPFEEDDGQGAIVDLDGTDGGMSIVEAALQLHRRFKLRSKRVLAVLGLHAREVVRRKTPAVAAVTVSGIDSAEARRKGGVWMLALIGAAPVSCCEQGATSSFVFADGSVGTLVLRTTSKQALSCSLHFDQKTIIVHNDRVEAYSCEDLGGYDAQDERCNECIALNSRTGEILRQLTEAQARQ